MKLDYPLDYPLANIACEMSLLGGINRGLKYNSFCNCNSCRPWHNLRHWVFNDLTSSSITSTSVQHQLHCPLHTYIKHVRRSQNGNILTTTRVGWISRISLTVAPWVAIYGVPVIAITSRVWDGGRCMTLLHTLHVWVCKLYLKQQVTGVSTSAVGQLSTNINKKVWKYKQGFCWHWNNVKL